MWLSRRLAENPAGVDAVDGVVTIGGTTPAVLSDGERRSLRVLAPGGLGWSPRVDDSVVLYGQNIVAGMTNQPPVTLAPGEICLYANGATLVLKNDGSIRLDGRIGLRGTVEISGQLTINGQPYELPKEES